MLQPDVLQPRTFEEALRALSRAGAVPLAGATDLIPAMRRGEAQPRVLVNLKHLPRLTSIRRTRSGVTIGACVKVADLLTDRVVVEHLPLLAEVARDFGSPQIRALATVGGNLCNAAPSADLALPLLVLDASVAVRSRRGVRRMPLSEFVRGVNKTALRRGEILTAVHVPWSPTGTGAAHAKLGVRRAMDLALVGVAAALTVARDGRRCTQARLALGAVAPIPMRARRAEALLEDNEITSALIAEAAATAAAEARPISDLRASADYRREMVETLARRVLEEALRRARLPGEGRKEGGGGAKLRRK